MRKHMMMTRWEDGWHFEFPQSNKSSRARNPIPSSSNPLPPPSSWLKCGWNASSFSSFWHLQFPQFNKSSCALTGNINSVPHISITDILHLKDDGINSVHFLAQFVVSHTLANPSIVEFLVLTLNALPTSSPASSSSTPAASSSSLTPGWNFSLLAHGCPPPRPLPLEIIGNNNSPQGGGGKQSAAMRSSFWGKFWRLSPAPSFSQVSGIALRDTDKKGQTWACRGLKVKC